MKFDMPERVLQDIVKAAKKQGGGHIKQIIRSQEQKMVTLEI